MARIQSSVSLAAASVAAIVGDGEFVIVELTGEGQKPVYDFAGQLLRFKTGAEASKEASRMTVSGRKFQPRRVKDDMWKDRERLKFASKEYKWLPWHDAVWWISHQHIWGDHFPHVSQKNSVGLMAFTETTDKGSADVQTAIKPGKYLERYFSGVLDQYIIRDLCTAFSNVFEDNCLIFANSEDEFETLYTSGPNSCMSHPKDKYTSHIHPVRVYAAGDLALVYMKRDGRIVARALCWPEKKLYSTIYGDSGRIEPLLQKEGYKKSTPYGARLQRILTWEIKSTKSGNQAFVAPHIDGCNYLVDQGDHLLIASHGNHPKTVKLIGASGVTEWVFLRCRCGKHTTSKELVRVEIDVAGTQANLCTECAKDIFVCNLTGHRVLNKFKVKMWGGVNWSQRAFKSEGFKCAGDGLNYPRSEMIKIHDLATGAAKVVSRNWYKLHDGQQCSECGIRRLGACGEGCVHRVQLAASSGLSVGAVGTGTHKTVQWQTIPRRR